MQLRGAEGSRKGLARLVVLVVAAAAAAGALLLWTTISVREVREPRPTPPVTPPPTPETADEEEPGTADLAEPAPVRVERPLRPLEGVVVDAHTEEPIERFTILYLPDGTAPEDEADWDDARSMDMRSAGGTWGLGLLNPGTYALRFEAAGYTPAVFEGMEIPTVLDGLEVRLDRGGWIHGRITSAEGEPVTGLATRLVPESSSGGGTELAPERTETDEEGDYAFHGLPPGSRWRVELVGLEGVLEEVPSSPLLAAESEEGASWDRKLPRLSELTIAITTRPRPVFAGYRATLWNSTGAHVEAEVRSGEARFPHVLPAFYELSIGKPDREPWYVENVEVPSSSEPLRWERTIRLPQREPHRPRLQGGRRGGAKRPGRR